jgi:hypothetical protein
VQHGAGERSDCIWIAHGPTEADEPVTDSPFSRSEAIRLIRSALVNEIASGHRVFVGFDFATTTMMRKPSCLISRTSPEVARIYENRSQKGRVCPVSDAPRLWKRAGEARIGALCRGNLFYLQVTVGGVDFNSTTHIACRCGVRALCLCDAAENGLGQAGVAE